MNYEIEVYKSGLRNVVNHLKLKQWQEEKICRGWLNFTKKTGFLVLYNNVLVIVDNCLIESKTNSRLYVPPFFNLRWRSIF